MVWLDALLWSLAVALFVVGDWLTTRHGVSLDGVHERNPAARLAVARLGLDAGILVLKTGALVLGAAGYLYAAGDPVTRRYRLLFPLVFVLIGAAVTAYNLRVLAVARDR